MDEGNGHFTYVLLMTARDDLDTMQQAFSEGVDDFINKARLRDQLLARVWSAGRLASQHNALLTAKRSLERKVTELTTTDLVDSVTGLGNLQFTLARLREALQQAASRGGAACLLMVGINNLDAVKGEYDAECIDELMAGVSARIRQLVRPLDIVTHPGSNTFAVITLQDSIENCTSQSFKRVFDNLYMQSFKTSRGYIPVVTGVSISAADADTGFPEAPEAFMAHACEGLDRSFETGAVTARPYRQTDG